MSSDEEDAQDDEVSVLKRMEMQDWFKFCKEKVDKIEKVWNKKLEDDSIDGQGSDEDRSDEGFDADRKIQDEKDQYEQ